MISIRKPLSFSEIGKKDNQEDYIFPNRANKDTRVFVLCDGMGGHEKGEVASKTVAEALGNYLSSFQEIEIPEFEEGLKAAYDALDEVEVSSEKKPGTTMTCLCINRESYLVAHIGDSRIYHIRPSLFNPETKEGGIMYQSWDHSLVNDLLKAGELTEEEAKVFPHKNIITRAMQPKLDRRYKADAHVFDDVEAGDYFFLCCDGVLEQLTDAKLCEILAEKDLSDEGKLDRIKAVCDGNTRDNYTCWLIPVDKVKIKNKTQSPLSNKGQNKQKEDDTKEIDETTKVMGATDRESESADSQAIPSYMDHITRVGQKIYNPLLIIVLGGLIALTVFIWLLHKLLTAVPAS